MYQPVHDLFGEVPVTLAEVRAWVESSSPMNLAERGYDAYVRRYDVAGKVRAAKLRGDFDQAISRRPPTVMGVI